MTFSNPHGHRVGPRWVRGEMVFAMPAGIVHIDPEKQAYGKEFVLIYSMEEPNGRPERVTGQYGIYDTKTGDPGYSPIWRYHFVIVLANTLRSEDDILKSGYEVIQSDTYTN
ncbi:MAG: hypothetical protein VCB79_11760 [Dehalococcoidia bacterium]